MKSTLAMVALAGLTVSSVALAENAPKADVAKGQQIATQVCAACHAADGNSMISANPVLAGQHAEYITKQLKNFKSWDGKPAERNNPVMAGMAAPLSKEDMVNLGAYFSQQKPKGGTAKNRELALEGQKIYRAGIARKQVPACAACHGPAGAGIPVQYPRLAGQHADYTLTQLKSFAAGQRANDPQSMMREVAGRMTEQEMKAVAEYISGLR